MTEDEKYQLLNVSLMTNATSPADSPHDPAAYPPGAFPDPRAAVPSIAFIGWNPFQIRHVLDVARRLENSCLLIEKRREHIFSFNEDLLVDSGIPVVIWPRERARRLDGMFDVVVCQTPFTHMNHFTKSRIAMIQYGYAKEAHNYGDWRAAASLCLAYGDYAARKLRPLCPVAISGSPTLDKWHDSDFHHSVRARYAASIDPARKTVLYAPTWGNLSTVGTYLDEVLGLYPEYNVILKLHHNTDLLEKYKRQRMTSSAPVFFGANDSLLDLLVLADVMLSDYSGAIFDAIYCDVPVILLHEQSESRFGEKLNPESLEYAARDRIGPVIEAPGSLRQTVKAVFDGKFDFTASNQALKQELYLPGPGAAQRAADALRDFAYRQTA